jgi:mxaK protein
MDALKRLPVWLYALAVLLAGGAAWQGAALWRLHRLNAALAAPDSIRIDEHTEPLLVFAKARRLAQTGQADEAIRLYTSLSDTADPDLRARALHNLATLYLQDAAKRWNAHGVLEAAHVGTEVELAKENYRQALRLNPGDWDARFNLEYAYRITPPPKERGKADFQGSKSSVFSTLPGLPGGGP